MTIRFVEYREKEFPTRTHWTSDIFITPNRKENLLTRQAKLEADPNTTVTRVYVRTRKNKTVTA